MELRQLKYAAKVAETGSFSEAARQLYVSQSSLSQQVKQLEDELGETLFERNSHHVSLTDVGVHVMPSINAVLAEAEACRDAIANVRGLRTGLLRVGMTYTFAVALDREVLQFMQEHRGVRFEVFSRPVEVLMDMLRRHEVDLVLSYRPAEHYDDVASFPLFNSRLAAVMSQTHPLAKRTEVSLAEVARYQMALPVKGMQARNLLDRLLQQQSLELDVRLQTNAVNILLQMVGESRMVTILSEITARRHPGLSIVPLSDSGTDMAGCYHLRRAGQPGHAVEEFIRLLKQNEPLWQLKIENQ